MALNDPDRRVDGTEGVVRAPKVGDTATVCHEYDPEDDQASVAVEKVDSDGYTVWLADFSRDELQLIE
ncbi:MAG: hypothetical protein AAF545_14110 [Pseudomonadota bacterium]